MVACLVYRQSNNNFRVTGSRKGVGFTYGVGCAVHKGSELGASNQSRHFLLICALTEECERNDCTEPLTGASLTKDASGFAS